MSDEKKERKSRDPFESGLIQSRSDYPRSPMRASIVGVLKRVREDRGLVLIHPRSRCIRKHDIHELIFTDEANAAPGGEVDRVAYLAFVEFSAGGVLMEGDKVILNGEEVGEIVGFDETHMPNHQNIVLRSDRLVSGFDRGARLHDEVSFVPVFSED